MPDERMLTACHEAGHAVVAVILELEFIGDVSIEPDEGRSGFRLGHADVPVVLGYADEETIQDHIKGHLVCYLAGAKAEEIYTGVAPDFWGDEQYADDRRGVQGCLANLAPADSPEDPALEEQDRLLEWADDRATQILNDNSSCVGAVIAALLERIRLSGDEVRSLVARSGICKT